MDEQKQAEVRTVTIAKDAAALVMSKDGTLHFEMPDYPENDIPNNVMLVASIGTCVSKRPGWLVEAVEWAMDECNRGS